jgi:anti-sigma regulatory factor (Ser/Thr protein kinase)
LQTEIINLKYCKIISKNNMMKHKTYWIYQVAGWGSFALANIFFGILFARVDTLFIIRLTIFIGTGFLLSHFMKMLIKKLKILQKPINLQIINAAVFTLLFALLSGIVISWLNKYFNVLSEYERHVSTEKLILSFSFTTGILLLIWNCFYFLYHFVKYIRREEQQKIEAQKVLFELEAKALRAQMNPHFIYNCLNSIKSLIQEDKKGMSIDYLTTFSKLIRTLFNNADKKEINLYDEIETCKLYLKLESMRLDAKFSYNVNVHRGIDLKSIHVPALIIQPFIENAIWHGILPKDSGGQVDVLVQQIGDSIEVLIDDNGIGREASRLNKSVRDMTHQSKGVYLTQSRLHLDNLITKRSAALEIIDKKNNDEIATGTTVILKFKDQFT